MTETAQGIGPAETEHAPTADPLEAAAEAFKISLGQTEAPAEADGEGKAGAPGDPPSADEPKNEPEEEAGGPEPEPALAAPLPPSWPRDKAELWESLTDEARAFIAQRDGQRDAAVNAKFMAAADLRKAHEAELGAARAERARALEAAELALALIRPQEPPLSMLEAGSPDYNPDAFHLARARADRSRAQLDALAAQRQDLLAQARAAEDGEAAARFSAINAASQGPLLADLPELADQTKAPAVLKELIDYAVGQGAPPDIFATPTTALEWHTLWKAREYDRLQAARAKLEAEPKPAPRKVAGPPVRPGIAVPPSARAAARRQTDLDRLATSGSVADGAAVFKHFLKG